MKKFSLHTVALALGLVFSAGAMAQTSSETEYKAAKDKIAAEYKSSKAACKSMSGNARDICQEEAKGKEKIDKAELEVTYRPESKTRYQARLARAEAVYGVAKERCDDFAGNAKDVCVKEAKSAQVAAKADAKVQLETTKANTDANKTSADARSDASEKKVEARKDATADKMDAEYKVAAEKCESLAGDAKTACMNDAKARFGKK